MFWNDPNLYGLTFKDVVTPPNPFLGSIPPWTPFQGIENPRVPPRFVPPYAQFGMPPQFPQFGMPPQHQQFGMQPQLPQFGMPPQFPQFGMFPQLPQYTLPTQIPQLGLPTQLPPFGMLPQFPQLAQHGMAPPFFNAPVTPFPPYIPTAVNPYFQPFNVSAPMFHPYRPFTV